MPEEYREAAAQHLIESRELDARLLAAWKLGRDKRLRCDVLADQASSELAAGCQLTGAARDAYFNGWCYANLRFFCRERFGSRRKLTERKSDGQL